MGNDKDFSLNNTHFDVLQEIGNIGAGNAVTSLSKMLSKKIDMDVPIIKVLNFGEVSDVIGGAENPIIAVLVNIQGDDIEGIMMFLIEHKHCHVLINILLSKEINTKEELQELELSAITEIGNILTSSYLNAIADLLNKKISTSIPHLSIDMAGAILSVPAIEFGKISDKVLFIESVFHADNIDVSGYFILVPSVASFKVIFDLLGIEL